MTITDRNESGRHGQVAARCDSCTCARECGTSHPKWSGPVLGLRRLEHARRRRRIERDRPTCWCCRRIDPARHASARSARRRATRCRPTSTNSTGCSAAASCRVRSRCSAANRASARAPCCSSCSRPGRVRRSTSPRRRALIRCGGGPSGWARSVTISGCTPRPRCRTSSRRSPTRSRELVVIDSIQTVHDPASASLPGSVGQVRGCAHRLVVEAKERNVAIVLVGHVTKDGGLAGPRVLEHVVDTVLQFEGDRHHALRLLRASKHRFGPTNELGLFEMCHDGLAGVPDPSTLFLADRRVGVAGSAVVPTMEGHRPIVVEVQALTSQGVPGVPPRRSAQGLDGGRLSMLMAVLTRRGRVSIGEQDVYASTAGGRQAERTRARPRGVPGRRQRDDRPPAAGRHGRVRRGRSRR